MYLRHYLGRYLGVLLGLGHTFPKWYHAEKPALDNLPCEYYKELALALMVNLGSITYVDQHRTQLRDRVWPIFVLCLSIRSHEIIAVGYPACCFCKQLAQTWPGVDIPLDQRLPS